MRQLRVQPVRKEIGRVQTTMTVGLTKQSRVELEIGGVGLPLIQLVSTLVADSRTVQRHSAHAVPEQTPNSICAVLT